MSAFLRLALCVTALAALMAASLGAAAKSVRVPVMGEPALDGVLDDACWAKAGVADQFLLEKTAVKPTQETRVYFVADEQALYVGVQANEAQPDLMTAKAFPGKGGVWDDDFVEVHFDVTNQRAGFFQMAVNPNGAVSADSQGIGEVEHLISAAARRSAEGWTAEVRIPLAALGVIAPMRATAHWGLNIGRARANASAHEETSVWNGAPLSADDVSTMGDAYVGPDTGLIIEGLRLEQPLWGAGNRGTFSVRSQGGAASVKAAGVIGKKRPQWFEATIGPQPAAAHFEYEVDSREARQQGEFSLRDAQGSALYRVIRPVRIPPLTTLTFLEPRYRGYVMPGLQKLSALVELGVTDQALRASRARLQVLDETGKAIVEKDMPLRRSIPIGIPANTLPNKSALRAEVTQAGRTLDHQEAAITRLSRDELAALASCIDDNGNLVVKGRPFFPLGWYGGHNVQHLDEVADSPFNCMLDYGINSLGPEGIRSYLDAAQARGVKIIYCMNDLYPTAKYYERIGPWTGYEEMLKGIVTSFKHHPALIAWYLNDELGTELVPQMLEHYRRMCELDPGHPTFIVHFVKDALAPFVPTTDILGIDVYPIPNRPIARVSDMADAGAKATEGLKPVWMVLQAFAWYQYREPEDPKATGRGRIPTESELRTGRAPTGQEERCMTYLALTHGAKGIIYYCYYDLRVLPQYEEMWAWMKEIGREVKDLSPVLLMGKRLPVECEGDGGAIHSLLLEHEGSWYLLAVNGEQKSVRCRFRLPEVPRENVEVLFEDRWVKASGARLSDEFGALGAHVYRLRLRR